MDQRWVCAAVLLAACGGGTIPGEQAPASIGLPLQSSAVLSSDCTGLMPTAAGLQQSFRAVDAQGSSGACTQATSDGDGVVYFGSNVLTDTSQDTWRPYSSAGTFLGTPISFERNAYPSTDPRPSLATGQSGGLALTGGFHCSPTATSNCVDRVQLVRYNADGSVARSVSLVNLVTSTPPDKAWDLASDPAGGVLLAHVGAPGNGTWTVYAQRFDANANALTDARPIWTGTGATYPTHVIAGVALGGQALVLWLVHGVAQGIWVDANGNPTSTLVTLSRSPSPYDPISLERLLDGSLVLQEGAFYEQFTPGSSVVGTAPSWLSTRPNTRLSIIRGRRGYLLAFPNTTGLVCAPQHFAVFAPSGTRCGGFDLAPDGPGSCANSVVGGSGRDGTVWAATRDPNSSGCIYRAWPGLLR